MTEDDPKRPASGPDTPDGPDASTSSSFWSELKRRKVFRVASVYVVTGWIIIQVASSTFENFGIPVWAFRFVTLMVLMGLPVAVILTWAFELTPEGFKTTKSARSERGGKEAAPEDQKKRNWMAYLTGALVPTLIFGALAGFFYIQARDPAPKPATVEVESTQVEEASMSIAMMPLINMSSIEENAYFAGGIHEDVLTNLSRIDDLKVVSRTTMLRYAASELTIPEIGEALDVDYIVEGSVRRIGNHVRVTVQLIVASSDEHLWASNYERELVDVFATQSELAREIGNAIHLEIQPESVGTLAGMPTTSVLAYDLYLKAISLEKTEDTTEENVLTGTTLLEEAVEADPDFVEAWALLKRQYDYMRSRVIHREWFVADNETPEEAIDRLEAMSDRAMAKAIALDPDNVETRLSVAVDHSWPQPSEVMEARRQIFEEIIETHPDNAMAWYHLAWWYRHVVPRDDVNSLVAFEAALKRDPFNARIVRAVLERYRDLGDDENVARLALRLTEIVPEVAEDRRLASIGPDQRFNRIIEAFLATADESLLNDFADLWEDPRTWDGWNDTHRMRRTRTWTGMVLARLTDNLNTGLELIRQWEISQSDFQDPVSFGIYINAWAMEAHLARGESTEAEACARKILDLHEQMAGVPSNYEVEELRFRVGALVVLGEMDEAWEQCETLLRRRGPSFDPTGEEGIRAMVTLDPDRAVEMALAEKARHPTWQGFDWAAAFATSTRPFVTHPRAMEYYLEEGKWVDFLAKRVPEYEEYRQSAD